VSNDQVALQASYQNGSAYDARFVNEGQASSVTTAMIVPNVVSSLAGVTNDGGDIQLSEGRGITITADDENNDIEIKTSAILGQGNINRIPKFSTSDGKTLASSMIVESAGCVGINNTTPGTTLDVGGLTRTKVLEITGGSDLAEPFVISGGDDRPAAGTVVVIDEARPGQLRVSDRAYDRRVAGVISGAGGIRPGLSLSQHGRLEEGRHVALVGRVYCLADAAYGPIRPGDRLCTSNTPGHAMRAADSGRASGAVLGKAMSSLERGRGLVLVLIQPQ